MIQVFNRLKYKIVKTNDPQPENDSNNWYGRVATIVDECEVSAADILPLFITLIKI